MQIIQLLKDKMKEDGISVLKLSNDTGIPAPRIYKWLEENSKIKPKYDDIITLKSWLMEHGVILKDSQNNPLVLGKLNPLEGKTSPEWKAIRLLINEVASLRAEFSGRPFEDCLYEIEHTVATLLKR